VDWIRLA